MAYHDLNYTGDLSELTDLIVGCIILHDHVN